VSVIWITGYPGSGKTTLAKRLSLDVYRIVILDGDELRECWGNLGFSATDRFAQALRAAHLAKILARQGEIPVVSLVSPDAAARRTASEIIGPIGLIMVHLATPLEECKRRKPSVYENPPYAIENVYEPPQYPDVRLSGCESVGEASRRIWRYMSGLEEDE